MANPVNCIFVAIKGTGTLNNFSVTDEITSIQFEDDVVVALWK